MELYNVSHHSDGSQSNGAEDEKNKIKFLHTDYVMSRYTHKSSQGCVYFVRGPDKVEYILKVF